LRKRITRQTMNFKSSIFILGIALIFILPLVISSPISEREYTKLSLKHCYPNKYGSYSSLQSAVTACSADRNCQGVYDQGCETGAGNIYLCSTSATHTSSEGSCIYQKKENEYQLVTIGGDGYLDTGLRGVLSSVEVTQVEKNQSCLVDSFPYDLREHSATIIPAGILVCGGVSMTKGDEGKRCYKYKNYSWESFPSMTTERNQFDMKFINQTVWAIGGDGASGSARTLDRFELHTNVWSKHNIPFDVQSHCLTEISDDKLILIGGHQNGLSSAKTWIFDTRTNTWTHGPNMKTDRIWHGCFSIEENGTTTKVVAMGGNGGYASDRLSTAEILDVASMQWQDLPDLPFPVDSNRGVESGIGPYLGFSVAGFSEKNGWEKRIVGLRKYHNGIYFWQELDNQLTTGRSDTAVVNVPDSMVPSC